MNDNPLNNATLNSIGDLEDPGPFVYTTKTGREKVTFPDPGALEWTEAEELLIAIGTKPDTEALKKWLSEEDYKTFVAEKLTLRQKNAVMRRAYAHYSDIFGTVGEGNASDG